MTDSDKHSSLLIHGKKEKGILYKTRAQCYKTFYVRILRTCNKLVFVLGKFFQPSLTNTQA